jgi:hypothetical protein
MEGLANVLIDAHNADELWLVKGTLVVAESPTEHLTEE